MTAEMSIGGYVIVAVVLGLSIYGVSLFVEWLIVKHVMNNPANGLLASIAGSFAIHIGYLLTSGRAEASWIGLGISGLAIAFLLSFPQYRRRKRATQLQQEQDELEG